MNQKVQLSFKALDMEGTFGHFHAYGYPPTEKPRGDTWQWCEQCKCWVTSRCDHRSFPCRERSIKMRKTSNEAKEA